MPFNPFAQNPTPPVDSDDGTIPDRMADDGRSGSQAVDDTFQSGVPDDDWSAVWADNRPEQASAESASIPADDTRDEGMPADEGWSAGNPDRVDETSNDGSWGGMWDGVRTEEEDEPPSKDDGVFGWNVRTPAENVEPSPERPDDETSKDDDWGGMWDGVRTEEADEPSPQGDDDFDWNTQTPAEHAEPSSGPAADDYNDNAPDRVDETSNDGSWGGMWDGEEDDEPPSQSNGDFGWNAQTPAERAEPGPEPAADNSGKAARNPPRPSHDWRDDISTETNAVPAFDWNVDENTTDWERDAEAEEHKPFPWRVVAVAALTLTVLCASGFGAAWLVRHQTAQQAYDASCNALATTGGKWRRLLKEAKALDVDTSELSSLDLTCAADADGTDAKTVKANGMVKKLSASVNAALDGKWEAFKTEAAKHPDLDTSALTETKPKTAADLDLLERRLKDMVDKAAKRKAAEEQKKTAEESQNTTEQTPSYTPPAQTYTPPAQTYTPPARPAAPSGNSDADM